MASHPNRGPKGPFSNPDPAVIRTAREGAGLSQTEAARLVRGSMRSWQQWEGGQRGMPPAVFELFKLKIQAGFSVADVVREVAVLADDMLDTRLASIPLVLEGLTTICEQAERFNSAPDSATRKDAALWLHDGYTLFSRGLPDTGNSETQTGWGTARIMSKMMGSASAWETRVKDELG